MGINIRKGQENIRRAKRVFKRRSGEGDTTHGMGKEKRKHRVGTDREGKGTAKWDNRCWNWGKELVNTKNMNEDSLP